MNLLYFEHKMLELIYRYHNISEMPHRVRIIRWEIYKVLREEFPVEIKYFGRIYNNQHSLIQYLKWNKGKKRIYNNEKGN